MLLQILCYKCYMYKGNASRSVVDLRIICPISLVSFMLDKTFHLILAMKKYVKMLTVGGVSVNNRDIFG